MTSRNIVARKKIYVALRTMGSPFTIVQMAEAAKLGVRTVQGLLPSMEYVRKEPITRTENGVRCHWWFEPFECTNCNTMVSEVCFDGFCRSCHVNLSFEDCISGKWVARQMASIRHSPQEAAL